METCDNGLVEPGEFCFVETETSLNPYFLYSGDFNGDNNLDVAYFLLEQDSTAMWTSFGDGTGNFFGHAETVLEAPGTYQLVAELDNYKGTDVLIFEMTTGTATSFLNKGDGTYTPPVINMIADASAPWNIALLLNADGDTDDDVLVEPQQVAEASLFVLTNDGVGNFQTSTFQAQGNNCSYNGASSIPMFGEFSRGLVLLEAECGGDPALDLPLTVFLVSGDGEIMVTPVPTTSHTPTEIIADDFDGDGLPEIIVWNDGSTTFSVYEGDSGGNFSNSRDVTIGKFCPPCENGIGPAGPRLASGHFDGGSTADVLIATDQFLFFGLNPLSAQPIWKARSIFAPRKLVGDFNNDGLDDIIIEQSIAEPVLLLISNP